MEAKHTPGPWTVAGDVKGQEAWCPTRHIYASADREAHGSGCVATVASSRANARLIAAAPAMLAALQDLVEDFGAMTGGCESIDVARAILNHLGVES